jgi:large subunit ribosomal protein L10
LFIVKFKSVPLSKDQKKKALDALKEKIKKQKSVVFVDFTGLKVKDMSKLRKQIRAVDGEFKAAKKTLMGIALKDAKLDADVKKMPGEVALVFSYKDEVSPAKITWQFSLGNQNIKILGGILENNFIGAEKVLEFAQLPSKEELLARLAGGIKAPVSNFVHALNYNIKGLVLALNAIKNSK